MKSKVIHAFITLLTVAMLLALYDRLVLRPALVIGIVDVADVYRAKEAEFTQLLTRSGADEDRQIALAMARNFSQQLPSALDELSRECGCMVLVKAAIVGAPNSLLDLTPALRRKVGAP
jgi:hypothetical protein